MTGPTLIAAGALLLLLLHQDFFLWDSEQLVLGFLPAGLAYHAAFSIATALLWGAAVKLAWPHDLIAHADQPVAASEPAPQSPEAETGTP